MAAFADYESGVNACVGVSYQDLLTEQPGPWWQTIGTELLHTMAANIFGIIPSNQACEHCWAALARQSTQMRWGLSAATKSALLNVYYNARFVFPLPAGGAAKKQRKRRVAGIPAEAVAAGGAAAGSAAPAAAPAAEEEESSSSSSSGSSLSDEDMASDAATEVEEAAVAQDAVEQPVAAVPMEDAEEEAILGAAFGCDE